MRSDKNGNDFYFLWTSERSGYRQMYLYFYGYIDNDGNRIGNGGEGGGGGGGSVGTVCCNGGLPVGGGGHWIVERYAMLFVSSLLLSQAITLFSPLSSLNSLFSTLFSLHLSFSFSLFPYYLYISYVNLTSFYLTLQRLFSIESRLSFFPSN
jgi:hypothetical protein